MYRTLHEGGFRLWLWCSARVPYSRKGKLNAQRLALRSQVPVRRVDVRVLYAWNWCAWWARQWRVLHSSQRL